MTTIERKDLVRAVLDSRDELDPDLDADLLEAIVAAEADAGEDGAAALRAIEAAITAAMKRGVGAVAQPEGAIASRDAVEEHGA